MELTNSYPGPYDVKKKKKRTDFPMVKKVFSIVIVHDIQTSISEVS